MAMALALLPRPAAAHPGHECTAPSGGVAAVSPAPEHCHHAQAGPCGDMLGCLAAPPALLTAPVGVRLLDAHAAPVAVPQALAHGRLGLGPPTPPPNS